MCRFPHITIRDCCFGRYASSCLPILSAPHRRRNQRNVSWKQSRLHMSSRSGASILQENRGDEFIDGSQGVFLTPLYGIGIPTHQDRAVRKRVRHLCNSEALPACKEKRRYVIRTRAKDGESQARRGFARSEQHTSANHGGIVAKIK
jgi:hypothetical protein